MPNDSIYDNEELNEVLLSKDSTAPYSFSDWVKFNSEVGELDRYPEYQKYVAKWNAEKREESDILSLIKSDYIDFIKSVYPYIEENDEFRLEDLDLDSKLSLELLIPVFTKRIKSIIMYFIDKRESVVRAKTKYNMHGAFISIERMLHDWLLSNYTNRKNRASEYGIQNSKFLPDLYDVNTKVTVRVDEYYDDQNYFDKNPALGASAYFDTIESHYASGGDAKMYGDWNDSGKNDIIWLFDGGLNERKLRNPIYYSVRDAVLGTSALSGYEAEVAANKYVYELTRKYIGNDIGYISGGYFKPDIREFRYDFEPGNNYIYFPSGAYDYQPMGIELSAININDTTLSANATGSDDYRTADKIFMRKEGKLQGAWLRKLRKEWNDKTMTVSVPMKHNYTFRYPFAGYGVSGDGVPWSGPLYYNNDSRFLSMDEDEKEAVKDAYWKNPPERFDCKPISIQRFNIADMDVASALGAKEFLSAMHMAVRTTENGQVPSSVYNNNEEQFWLYYPSNTEFVVNDCKNYYEFPHFKLNGKDDRSEFYDIRWCAPVALSGVSTLSAFRGAMGGNCPANSDILYRIDDNGKVTDAAWLSATPVTVFFFTSGDAPGEQSTVDYAYQSEALASAIKEGMGEQGWKAIEFLNKYDLVNPKVAFAGEEARVSGMFQQYEYSFIVNPGEDELFVYTGWSPYDDRKTYGDEAMGGPFVSALFLGESPMPEFATVPYEEGCADYDYIYPLDDWPTRKTDKEKKECCFFLSGGQWHSRLNFKGFKFDEKPVIVKNVLYKYHRSSTAKVPGVFRIINEAYSLSSTPLADGYDGDASTIPTFVDSEGSAVEVPGKAVLKPVTYTRWCQMRRYGEDDEWVGLSAATDMIIRSGDRLVYDAVRNRRVVVESIYDTGEGNSVFEFHGAPYLVKIPLHEVRPYWASACNTDTEETGYKSVDVHSNGIRWDSYLYLMNPLISNRVVNPLEQMSVYSKIPFVWEQPIHVYEPCDDIAWCKLSAIYYDVPMSGVYANDHIVRDLWDAYTSAEDMRPQDYQKGVISAIATDDASDIEFSYTDGDQTIINYWANNSFTWTQKFLNVKNGVPPTGGLYVPYEISESGVEAIVPNANLSNRHYPTMAVAPDASQFYKKEDVGGYFTPQYLGVTEAITKHPELEIDPSKRTEEENCIEPITVGETFAQDDGFTKGTENKGISVKHEDLDWAKIPMGIAGNAGMRADDRFAQSFVPYITEEECRDFYDKGISRADDTVDPWKRDGGYDFDINKIGSAYKEHMTRQQPIERWAGDRFVKHEIAKYKADIYGFNYVLVKNTEDGDCIYDQRLRYGHAYYRGFDESYHDISEISKQFCEHPVVSQGLMDDIDVAYDMFYATGTLPTDPLASLRSKTSAMLATWESRFDLSGNAVSGGSAASTTPFGVYTQADPNEGQDPEKTPRTGSWENEDIKPIYNACLWELIAPMMRTYSRTYNIPEFEKVWEGCENPYDTFNSLRDTIEDLYDGIRDHFIRTIEELPINDFYLAFKEKGERGEILKNQLDDIREAMVESDGKHPKDTAYGVIWHLVRTCEELMKFHLFSEGYRCYFAFPIVADADADSPLVQTNVGKVLIKEYPFPCKISRPWFLDDRREYIIPMTMLEGRRIVPVFDCINTKTMAWEQYRGDDAVQNKLTSLVGNSLGTQIKEDYLITPVCSYNDKTENLVVVQQVSGAHSFVGPLAIYNFNLIDRSIDGTAIVPVNKRAEADQYDIDHPIVRPEEHEPSGKKTSGNAYAYFYDYGGTDGKCIVNLPIEGNPLYDYWTLGPTDTPSGLKFGGMLAKAIGMAGYNCPVVDGKTFKVGGNGVRLDELHDGYRVYGVYEDKEFHTPYDFERDMLSGDSNFPGYILWERTAKLLPIVGARCSIEIGYTCSAMSDFHKGLLVSENDLDGIYYIPNVEMSRLAMTMAEYDERPQASYEMYMPEIFLTYELGYELPPESGFSIVDANNETVTAFSKFQELYDSDIWAMATSGGCRVVVGYQEATFTFDDMLLRYRSADREERLNFSGEIPSFHLYDNIGLSAKKESGTEFYWDLFVHKVHLGENKVYRLEVPTDTKIGGFSTIGFENMEVELTSGDIAVLSATSGFPKERKFEVEIPASAIIVDGPMTLYVNYYEGVDF